MNNNHDLHIAVYWVTCCMILHNMVVHFEHDWRGELGNGTMLWAMGEAEEWGEGEDEEAGEEQGGTEGQRFQTKLMENLIRQHGICL